MKIGVYGSCVIKNELWFLLTNVNAICKMNLDNGEIEYITSIPDEDDLTEYLYSDIRRYKDWLILAPMNAKEIAIYDLQNKNFKKVKLSTEVLMNQLDFVSGSMFYSSIVVDDCAYFIPYRFPAIVRLNLKTFELSYFDKCLMRFFDNYNPICCFFREDIALDKESKEFSVVSLYYNSVMRFNTADGIVKEAKRGSCGFMRGYSCIAYKNGKYYLMYMYKSEIHICDGELNVIKKMQIDNSKTDQCPVDFIGTVENEEYIFFIPYATDVLVRVSAVNDEVKIIKKFDGEFPKYTRNWIYKDQLFCYRDCAIDIYDLDGVLLRSSELNADKEIETVIMRMYLKSNSPITESKDITLSMFLNHIGDCE